MFIVNGFHFVHERFPDFSFVIDLLRTLIELLMCCYLLCFILNKIIDF